MLGQIDETQIVLNLLRSHWNPHTIAEPTIAKKKDHRTVDVSDGDFILGYPLSRNFSSAVSSREYVDVVAQVALDVRTDDEGDIELIEAEIKRICREQRFGVTYFDFLVYVTREVRLNYRGLFRSIHTVELRSICDSVRV